MAKKSFYADIELIESKIVDADGNTISLNKDERNAVTNASTSSGVAVNADNPLTSKDYVDKSIEDAVSQVHAGVYWRDPVDTTSTESILAPTEDVKSYLNLTDNKIYRTTNDTSWDLVEVPKENWSLVVKDSDEQYTFNGDDNKWIMKSSGAIPNATKEVKGIVQVGNNVDVSNGVVSVKDASVTDKGVVQLASHNEVASSKALQSDDPRIIVGHNKMAFTDQDTVTFVHNLNSVDVLTQVIVASKVVDAEITVTDENTVTVQLSKAMTGKVLVVAI